MTALRARHKKVARLWPHLDERARRLFAANEARHLGRLFSFIATNWRGEPLRDYETIVRLIATTTTAKGLAVTCRLDRRRYPVGRKVTDAEIATVRLYPHAFHGEWNYAIRPHLYMLSSDAA